MVAKIIDGKAIADKIKSDLKTKVEKIVQQGGRAPGLAVVLVGEDPASQIYVSHKEKACKAVGFQSFSYKLPASSSESEIIELITKLNNDTNVDGILLQLPLPKPLDSTKCIHAIDPKKDVDGLHPINQGLLIAGLDCMVPCTPAGIMVLIKSVEPNLKGKLAAVIGRSILVGKPVRLLLEHEHCTTIGLHSRTVDPQAITKQADILVAAVGVNKLVREDWVKEGAVVIDVGMHRDANNKLSGDVDFESVSKVAGSITPVPGGVGPMTIAMLLQNCMLAYERR